MFYCLGVYCSNLLKTQTLIVFFADKVPKEENLCKMVIFCLISFQVAHGLKTGYFVRIVHIFSQVLESLLEQHFKNATKAQIFRQVVVVQQLV